MPWLSRISAVRRREGLERAPHEQVGLVQRPEVSRMERVGLQDQTIIGPQLLDEIHFRSLGIPRLINAICDNVLLTAFAMETRVATMEMLDAARLCVDISADAGAPST
jgi:hypothetical protein